MSGPAKISQVGLVVRDLEKTMKMYHELLGWGPWNVYEHVSPRLHDTHLRGEPAKYSMLCAETMVDGVCFELIQPLDGPNIYSEWLEEHGEGFHHLAVMKHSVEESDAFKKMMVDNKADIIMGGRIGETIEFYYIDTQPMLKIIIESGTGHAIDLKPTRVYPEPAAG
ncbi:VOC family protein [Microvirga sp. GCM10011540]|uniref:VOC family protein n=1 Tax=Microvirga sp. GCM10011540 TaxID=3317338 RepID=UPI003617AB12